MTLYVTKIDDKFVVNSVLILWCHKTRKDVNVGERKVGEGVKRNPYYIYSRFFRSGYKV